MSKEMFTVKNSSNVASVGYDTEAGILTVSYNNNRSYDYYDVPPEVFAEIQSVESVGTYLASEVKGKFSTKPVEKGNADEEDTNGGDTPVEPIHEEDEEATAGISEPAADDEIVTDEPSSLQDVADICTDTSTAAPDGVDEEIKEPEEPSHVDQEPPTNEQSENLNTLRSKLNAFGIDMQYERGEEKTGEQFWNIKASVEKKGRTLHQTYKITENCTKSEIEAAVVDIARCFVIAE